MFRDGILDHVKTDGYVTMAASSSGTTAQGFLGPVPAGYLWYLERMSVYSASANVSSAMLEVSVQQGNTIPTNWDRATRQDYSANLDNIADELNAIHCHEGWFIVFYVTGLANNDVVTVSTQIAVHLKSLQIQSRQVFRQEHESAVVGALEPKHHERSQSPPDPSPAEHSDETQGGIAIPEPTPDERDMHRTLDLLKDQ